MLNFKQFLEEGRDAPLYHATYTEAAAKILKDGVLMGVTKHKLPNATVAGVSLSRDLKTATNLAYHEFNHNTVVVFELDQRKLAQRHKIKPLNFYMTNFWKQEERAGQPARYQNSNFFFGKRNNEYEEFVLGDIKNVDKYIKKIHSTSNLTTERIEKYPNLHNHPKLFINGKFVNA
jgi:hypothetical protein